MTIANDEILRISFPNNQKEFSIKEFDPVKINYIHQWDLALNLYSRLISFNNKGELISGLAKKFYWKDDVAHFEIRTDFKTIDGKTITPEDVVFSLKRLIKLNTNTHGKLENIICDFKHTDNIEKNCTGITFLGNEVLIKTNKKDLFLFKTLTSSDFSILKKEAVNQETLQIEDYRNTSGPYYFSHYNDKKNIVLKANPHHWHYSKIIPQEVEILVDLFGQADNGKNVASKILDRELDAISISSTLTALDYSNLKKNLDAKKREYSFYETAPFMLAFLKFSSSGFGFCKDLRFAILQDIQEALRKNKEYLSPHGRIPTPYIFQSNAHGSLTKQQEEKYLTRLNKPISQMPKPQRITIAIIEKNRELFEKILKNTKFDYSLVTYPSQRDFPEDKITNKELPHLFLGNQDIIFEEDINLLSFAFSFSDIFSIKGDQATHWLNTFRNEDNASKRMEMVKNLHFDSLFSNTSVIPLYTTSLRAIATGPWKLHFARTAGTPFWMINKE